MSRLKEITCFGQQIWLDNLTRTLFDSGSLARWVVEDGISGLTSNPAIFYNAFQNDPAYQAELARIKQEPISPEARFERLALPDVRRACDILRPLYEQSEAKAGFVSFEISPSLADNLPETLLAAKRLWREIGKPNAMIKIPATKAGIKAIEELIAEGININATLIFGLAQLAAVQSAYYHGIKTRAAQGKALSTVASVASVFISRIDTFLDPLLPPELQGKTAIAFARAAYARFSSLPELPSGATPQKLLWASTSCKNPAYRDVCYVEELIGKNTINTVPDVTLAAFRDHGVAAQTLPFAFPGKNQAILDALPPYGIDLEEIEKTLLAAGLQQFKDAFSKLLKLFS